MYSDTDSEGTSCRRAGSHRQNGTYTVFMALLRVFSEEMYFDK
jgi:hypothetical protein